MAFECPACKHGTLEIGAALELPADAASDEITLQLIACAQCGFQGAAVYEESRRGSLDGESWRHAGYEISTTDYAALAEAIDHCPEPANARCPCPGHQAFGKTDRHGYWEGLKGMQLARSFAIVRKA